MKLLILTLSLILSTSIFATKKLSVNVVTVPPNASIFSNNTNYDSQKYHKQKDSFVKRPTEKQTKKIYLFKNGFMLKEYKLDNNSPEKITIELEKAAEFNLSLNTKLDYEISYTPFVDELDKDLQTKSRIFLSETKYFPKNMKSMKLPQGKYYLILSKLGYKTIHKKVNLNKDTVLAIKDVKRSVFALGFEGITEYNVFLNVDNVSTQDVQMGMLMGYTVTTTKGAKFDLFRVGFSVSIIPRENLVASLKFSLFNIEAFIKKNIYISFSLFGLFGDTDLVMLKMEDGKTSPIIAPFGSKIGYMFEVNRRVRLKVYQKINWLISMETKKHGLGLITGLSLEIFL